MDISIAQDWFHVPSPPQGKHLTAYQKVLNDGGHLTVFVGLEPNMVKSKKLFWHLSISHRSNTLRDTQGCPLPGRIPTWEEIREARYKFVPDEVNMAVMLPPKRLYINVHPTTMHLFEIPIEYAS